jgi:6-phosphogluconate dehydrogenase
MQIGLVGLGRMGMNMGRRWLQGKHEVIAYNRTFAKTQDLAKEGAVATQTLKELVGKLKAPRIVWLMLPEGAATEEHLQEVADLLSPGDLIVNGANYYYKDDIRHAEQLKAKKISYMDAGVSGGIWGLKVGYCTMVGGDVKDFQRLEPLLKTLAPKDGYLHCGGVGGGHFVKMVHNGIEYGMMQAYAEGFEILQASPYKPDNQKVAHLWNQGSVVRSWLLELAEEAFGKDLELEKISGYVEDSGEGR